MQIDDEPEIGLTKWPFYLGDALLVAVALAIAILGDWQLSDWQVVSCVLAVALGAGLFVLPYLVEYYMLAQEKSEGSAAELKILRRQILQAEDAVERTAVRIHQMEETLAAQVQSAEVVSEVMDGKFKQLEAELAQSAATLSGLAQQLEALAEAPAENLADQLQALQQQLEQLQVEVQQRANASDLELLTQRLDRLQQAVESVKAARVAPVERAAETRLLQRAIPQQAAATAAAVSRIINPRPREEHGELIDDEDEADLEVEETERELTGGFSFEELADMPIEAEDTKPDVAPLETEESVVEATEAQNSEVETQVEEAEAEEPEDEAPEVETQAEESEVEVEAAVEKTEAEEPEPEEPEVEDPEPEMPQMEEPEVAESESEVEEPAPAATPAPVAEAPVDLFPETVPVARRARRRKADSAITASVLIGIGNKPYLRGSGGGLSWERGVVMDFEEIGKWGWLAPADFDTPIEFQIFCNDADPDRKGKYTLEPGQKLEISPVF